MMHYIMILNIRSKTQLDTQVLYRIFIIEELLTFSCTKYKSSQIAKIFSANNIWPKVNHDRDSSVRDTTTHANLILI